MKAELLQDSGAGNCGLCGKGVDEHRELGCWDFDSNAYDASKTYTKFRKLIGDKRPTWDIVEAAFRAGFSMRSRRKVAK